MNAGNDKTRNRVLLIDLGGSMGGVEAYLEALAQILSGENEIFALCAMEELAAKLAQRGVRVFRVPLFARLRLLRYLAALLVMIYVIVRYRMDVMQINGYFESFLLLPARLLGCQSVYTRHGPLEIDLFPWYRNPIRYVPRFLSRYGAGLATHIVCVSEAVGAVYKPLFPAEQVSVIPNWVASLPEITARLKTDLKRLRILYVGRLEQYKGVQILLEAVRRLEHVDVTVLGTGEYRGSLERLAQGMPVEFVGFHRDPTRFYQSADIFVMPSLGPEGLPMVSLEAMSHALPCILSDLPVHCEITENGRAALLFRRGDANDLRDKLSLLIENDGERAHYAAEALRRIEARYNPAAAQQAYCALFQRLCERPRRGPSVPALRSQRDANL